MRTFLGVLVGLMVAQEARALDGYQDRRGLYGALAVGGGMASANGEREAELRVAGRIGAGLSDNFTADLSLDYATLFDSKAKTFGFDLAANYFLIQNFFLRAGGGLAILLPDGGDRKAGFGALVGAGVEFFVGADLAASAALTYEPELYGDPIGTVHQLFVTIAASWY